MAKKRKLRFSIRPELLIIALLIICDLQMMNYDMNARMSGNLILDADGKIAICHNKEPNHNHTGEQILWKFDAQTCRFIEVRDEELQPVFRMIYADIPLSPDPLDAYIEQFDTTRWDQVQSITVQTPDSDSAELHYVWTTHMATGKLYLLVCSESHAAALSWRLYTVRGYLIFSLSLALAIINMYWQCVGTVRKYKRYKNALEDDF